MGSPYFQIFIPFSKLKWKAKICHRHFEFNPNRGNLSCKAFSFFKKVVNIAHEKTFGSHLYLKFGHMTLELFFNLKMWVEIITLDNLT
jgi:hypothetical protein